MAVLGNSTVDCAEKGMLYNPNTQLCYQEGVVTPVLVAPTPYTESGIMASSQEAVDDFVREQEAAKKAYYSSAGYRQQQAEYEASLRGPSGKKNPILPLLAVGAAAFFLFKG